MILMKDLNNQKIELLTKKLFLIPPYSNKQDKAYHYLNLLIYLVVSPTVSQLIKITIFGDGVEVISDLKM